MDISELCRREDFHAVLLRTLQTAWSREQGQPVSVRLAEEGGQGQRWRLHPLYQAYTVAGVGPAARRHMANSIRYTSRRWRRPLQWVVGTALSTPPGLALGQRPGILVTPPLDRAADLVLAPGNQRIRLFDLGTGRTRVYAKDGFSNALMKREIGLRAGGEPGPYSPILAHDESMTWFEESIIEGWCLARLPARVNPTEAVERALTELEAWSRASSRQVDVQEHVDGLEARIKAGLATLAERFGHDVTPWQGWLDALMAHVGGGEVAVGPTHGDAQAGNIMVHADGRAATWIDWEHCTERMLPFDRLVLALGARLQRRLAANLVAFLKGRSLPWLPTSSPVERTPAVASRFLLEDLTFQVEEAAGGPYLQTTAGLRAREGVLSELGPGLEALWRA